MHCAVRLYPNVPGEAARAKKPCAATAPTASSICLYASISCHKSLTDTRRSKSILAWHSTESERLAQGSKLRHSRMLAKKNANFMCYVMMLRRKCPTPMGLKTKCKNCSNESFGRLSVHLRDGVCGWTVVDLVFPCSLWPGTLEESQIYDMYIHIYRIIYIYIFFEILIHHKYFQKW